MSFFRNRTKEKEKDSVMLGKKHQFYVQFLGWIECRGLRGQKYTDPIVDDLRRKQRKWKTAPKLTLQVNKKELKISQDVEEKKKKKIKTIKFPLIPTRDITYVKQAINPIDGTADDIVACIYLGYVPRTQRYVHVHVYRFDTAATAQNFVRFLNLIIDSNMDRINRAERTLMEQGEIQDPRLGSSDGMSDPHTNTDSAADSAASTYSGDTQPSSDEFMDPDVQSLMDVQPFDSVTDEFKLRLTLSENMTGPPLLLPPKDYDTIRRGHGNLSNVDRRKCLQLPIVGEKGLTSPKSPRAADSFSRPRNESGESGIDLEFPSPTDSEKRVPSIPEEDDAKEPLSAIDYSYPAPNSARSSGTPRRSGSNYDRHEPTRQTSMSSAYSSHSHRSDGSSHSNGHSNEQTLVNGKDPLDHPPADYEDEHVVMRRGPMYSKRDLSKSLSGNSFHSDIDSNLHRSMPANVLRHTIQSDLDRNRQLDLHKSAPSSVLRHTVQNGVGVNGGLNMHRNTPPPQAIRHSMQNGAEYAVVNKFNRQSANATQYVGAYSPRSQDNRVRRTHSMYK